MRRSLLSVLLFLISLASLKETNGLKKENKCSYKILVKTGTVEDAGTNAIVSLVLAGHDRRDREFSIPNLKDYGILGPDHHYFQKDNLDAFEVPGPCLPESPCSILLFHDNSWNSTEPGYNPGWYVEYLQVNTTEPGKETESECFEVKQWLALDQYPHQLHFALCVHTHDHTIKLKSQV